MKRQYETWNPRGDSRAIVEQAEAICDEMTRQGYTLTLRQLYYQFVRRALIPNNQQSYNRLGAIVNRARMAGLLDWWHIEDRGRALMGTSHWDSPADIINSVAGGYRIDKWSDQPRRVEVWVEKEALAGVIGRTAAREDCPYFACKGYTSQSAMWEAGQRIARHLRNGQAVTILHLGDHDPSGIDMTRDIMDRLRLFVESDVPNAVLWRVEDATDGEPLEVRRIALNMPQVLQYNPPPNPAKMTDSRVEEYLALHGDESWELDALEPATLDALITEHIEGVRDDDLWQARVEQEREERQLLAATRDRWDELVQVLRA